MRNIFKRLRRKFFTDRADSILVPALILAPIMAITLGLAVEVVKNNYVRGERIDAIQDSASAAVTLTDTKGSLNWRVVDKIVNEYEHNRFGKRVFSTQANSGLKYDTGIRETAESSALETFNAAEGGCLTGRGDEANQRYPQYEITLDTGRGESGNSESATVSFVRAQPTLAQLNQLAPLKRVDANNKPVTYRSVTVKIIDQAPNLVMGMLGSPCQKFDLTASSVTFSADSDLR